MNPTQKALHDLADEAIADAGEWKRACRTAEADVSRQKILNAELVIERDNLTRQRAELRAALESVIAWTDSDCTAAQEWPRRLLLIRNCARAALAKGRP